MEQVTTIETQLAEVVKQHKSQVEYLENIKLSLTKLRAEELTTMKNLDTLNGAMQAYNNALNILKEEDKCVIDASVVSEIGEN